MAQEDIRDVFIAYEGHSLYVRCYDFLGVAPDEGAPTPIFLVHGLLLNPRSWCDHQIKVLQQVGPVYSLSLPGHAPSLTPAGWNGPVTEAFIDATLTAQISHFVEDTHKYLLIGHSTGALACWVHAIRHPDRVLGIVSSSTTCHGREMSGQFFVYQTMVRKFGVVGRAAWWLVCRMNSINLRLHQFLVCDAAHNKKQLIAYPYFEKWMRGYFQYQKILDSRATGAWLRDLYDIDTEDGLSTITCPVLLLYGEYDPYVATSARLAFLHGLGNNPQVTDVVLADTGHLHMLEAPEAFEQVVLNFIDLLPNALSRTES